MHGEFMRSVVLAIPLLPLAIAIWFGLSLAVGIRLRERTIAVASIAVSVICAVAALSALVVVIGDPAPQRLMLARWLFVPGHEIDVAFWIDPLSAIMMAMTTVLSFVVSWFSVAYMHREPGFQRYFMLVNLFVTGMLVLVMGDGFTLLFLGWEWVGLCSALLIGFFHERAAPVRAGARAFFTNRLGDFGLLTAAMFATHEFGGDTWGPMMDHAGSLTPGMATVMGLALWLAAMSKSAQLPFSSWMAHAVEGPTTSTGLFYGAVMAHAGVYLMLRASPIVAQSDVTMLAMLLVGGATLVYATAVGAAQPDAKSSIIYATIAQLGGMFAACGAGAWNVVVVLMVLHAGLRAVQFLFAPSIIVRTRAAQHRTAANDDGVPRGRALHTGLIGAALVVAAWSMLGLSDLAWWYGPLGTRGPLAGIRDTWLAAAAVASVLMIAWVGLRRPESRNPFGLAARLRERALHRFDLDAWQVKLAVTPLLRLGAVLKRFDDRFRDRTRALIFAGLVVAGLVGLESFGAELTVVRRFTVTDNADGAAFPWLSALWVIPAITAFVVYRIEDGTWARIFARGGAATTLALAIAIVRRFDSDVSGMQFVERLGHEVFGIGYHLGVDGISVVLVFLQAAVMTLLLAAVGPRTRREGLVTVLVLHALGMLAVVSVNLFVMALLALVAILPGALLLQYAGPPGSPRVETSTYVRPMLGSGLLVLAVVLALGNAGPVTTFDFEVIAAQGVPGRLETLLFVPILLAIAMRLPLVPFHGWMVHLLEDSPALASIPLTLVPFGQYLFLRIGVELLGDAFGQHTILLSSFAVASMFYCVFVGFAQGSLRSSLAYFQLAIAGGMLVGIASVDPMGPTAGLLNACSLSIAGTGLLLVADMIHSRVGSTDFAALGGIVRTAPVLSGLLLVIALAYAGFPGTLGFVAEHLSGHGAFDAHPAIAMAMLGAVNLASALLWWSFTRACLGPWKTPHLAGFPELLGRERAVLAAIAAIVLISGWWLEPWVAMIQPTVAAHMP
jgi:NADH:ubiquinone oxidoreductase subunit 5 (subunit L)/multisubunit Na+/H+ antiporter MnhA subunit